MTITGKEAIDRIKKQQDRQNDHIRNNYDRVSVTLPKGSKERIKSCNKSINGLINELVEEWLQEQEEPDQEDNNECPFA